MSRKPAPKKKNRLVWPWLWLGFLATMVGIAFVGNDRFWLATFVGSVPSMIFVAITVLMAACLAFRKTLRGNSWPLLLTVPLHWIGTGFCLNFPSAGGLDSYKVMTWNIHHGELGIEKVIRTIREEKPDVLLLQEIQPDGSGVSLVRQITQKLDEYDSVGDQESAVLTTHRIRRSKVHELDVASHRRWVAEATVELGDQEVRFFSVHLLNGVKPEWFKRPASFAVLSNHAEQERWRMINQLHRILPDAGHVVLGGDFNTIPMGGMYRRFAGYYQDAFAQKGRGLGFTYPAKVPGFRIDYVWASKNIHVTDAGTVSSPGSDHKPVVAWIIPKR